MTVTIYHDRLQYGVGQGAFHGARVRASIAEHPVEEINYVFDCGALKGSAPTRELTLAIKDFHARVSDSMRLDLLVISHFDMDHMNGVGALINSMDVRRVYMPYIDTNCLEYLLARALEQEATENDLKQFAEDISEVVFSRTFRGIPVTLVRHNPEANPGRRGPAGVDGARITDEQPDGGTGILAREPGGRLVVPPAIMDDNWSLEATSNGRSYWRFSFWNYRSNTSVMTTVRNHVQVILQNAKIVKANIKTVTDVAAAVNWLLQHSNHRSAMLKAYRAALGQHSIVSSSAGMANLLSVCMASTPAINYDLARSWVSSGGINAYGPIHSFAHNRRVGWIGTGDAPLGNPAVRSDFIAHFNADMNEIDTVQVPHHGAHPKRGHKFFHKDILGSAIWATISAGMRNPYKHPHATVTDAIVKQQRIAVLVTEARWPAFYQGFELREH